MLDVVDGIKLQPDFNLLVEWCKDNKLKLNISVFVYLTVGVLI